MANNTINVTYKVNEDGSLEKIATSAKKAARATEQATGAADNYSKKQKGVAGATSNGTKAFSKMLQGITGGLVPAYATLAANVFALSAAFNFFKRAADVKILEQGQIAYGKATGLALQTVTRGLREASGGMLGFREAAEAAAIGVAKGFSPQQLNELAEGARKASAALGRNFEDSFDRLIRGASKAEPELLDELGITLRLETATKRYGDAINKNAKDLTAYERSQAVLMETQRQLNEMYGDVDAVSNPFVQLGKTFDDLVKTGTNFILPFFEAFASIINRSAVAAISVFGMFALSILKSIVPMGQLKQSFTDFQAKQTAALDKAKADQEAYKQKIQQTEDALRRANAESAKTGARKLRNQGVGTDSKLIQKAAAGTLTDPKQIGQLKSILKNAEAEYKRHGEVRTGMFKGADLKTMQNFRMSLENMNRSSVGFVKKTKMHATKISLGFKVAFSKMKAAGTSTFAALGRGAERMSSVMNKAMKAAGIIGILMMIWEVGQEIIKAPYDIMMALVKGIQFVIKSVLVGFGGLIDAIGNLYKGMLNFIIDGYNWIANTAFGKSMGMKAMEPLNSASTAARDAMENLADSIDLVGAVENTAFAKSVKGFQERQQHIAAQKEAYDNLKNSIRDTGEELGSLLLGLEGTSGSKRETNIAQSIGSLGVSTLMTKATKIEDPEQQANAMELLKKQLKDIGELSPAMLAAVQAFDIEKVRSLEMAAQGATGGLTALKDGITNINSALAGGDLLTAEFALKALKETSIGTSNAFKALFGEDSAAAKKALQDFEESFSAADMTAGQFLDKIIQLRHANEALARTQEMVNFMGDAFAKTMNNRLALLAINNQLTEKELLLAKENDEKKKVALENEIAILKIKQKIAEIPVAQDSGGDFLADAKRMSGMNETMKNTFAEGSTATVQEKILAVQGYMSPMLETLAKLGPDGELISAVVNGALSVADSWTSAMSVINDADATGPQKLAAGLEAAAATVSALQNVMAAASKATIAGIDSEIEAEKKRDGKSKESLAKIAQLEKKKENEKRKAFEMDKKMKMASAIIATALGITNALAEGGPIMGPILAAMIGAMGAAQIAIISGTSYQGGGSAPETPSKIAIGNRQNSVDMARARSPSGELAYARGAAGTGTGMTNFTPAFTGMKYRASGGNTGLMVGEQGPELFIPDRPGRVVPADETARGGAPVNVNFTIQAIDTQNMEQALMAQRGAMIGMIREAANAHGENFLESINTEALTREN